MAVMTYMQQLEQVQTAITEIELGAQATTIQTPGGSRTITMANIEALYKRETRLRKLVSRESRGGGIGISFGVPN